MDMQHNDAPRTTNLRRRPRSKLQIFKEAYLPTIILAVTIVLIIVFIIGAAVSGDPKPGPDPSGSTPPVGTTSTPPTPPPTTSSANYDQEAADLLARAQALALDYDYEGAMALLDTFTGDAANYPELGKAYNEYSETLKSMVSWKAGDVVNLSFHLLIADPSRAFTDAEYGSSYKRNFITVDEFKAILQQLYDNGYVLVGLDHFYSQEYNASSGRYVFTETELLLPAGKTPVMLTETNANYYTYMTDSNGDGKPDAGADGFACRLCHDDNGFYNEIVNADGSVSTGAYDMVPLLEDFIAENPDFSYKGARAIVAFTGYDGVLGYRINATRLGADALQAERDGAAAIVEALKNGGYDLACFTYANVNYNNLSASDVQADIQKWLDNIAPWIGNPDILVYAKDIDIAGAESYSGNSKFNVLYNAGFTYYLGVGNSAWNQVDDLYVRHNRLVITGYNLQNNPSLYTGLFDPAAVLDSARN